MGNLENEPEFFRHSLVAAAPGDLLLLDLTLVVPDTSSAEAIWKQDPALQKPITPLHERWLKGPLFRYCTGITDVKLSYDLDLSRPIPGSYGLISVADVRLMGGQSHRFSMWSVRRYRLPELVKSLRMLGWEAIEQYPYGEVDVGHPSSLLVLQKRHDGRASFRQA